MSGDDAITKIGDVAASAGIRRVHILAWRDLEDVEAGGSEVHAATIARLWAAAGLEVVQRTSYAQGRPPRAMRDGYEVVRRAGRYLVFPRAVLAEMAGRHGQRDALVEIWNGMPFLSPVWARGPKAVLLHHVHAEMWKMVLGAEAPWLATAGDVMERRIAPFAYRRTPVVTLSESSKHDIVEQLGLRADRVSVIPPGVDPAFTTGGSRTPHASIVAVGRLVPVKRYDRLIRAVALARRSRPDLTLTMVGDGYERPALETLVGDLDADWVTFAGHVDDATLVSLYQRSWLVASASAREGWGMSITEAGACATPSVVTRIPGHADAVADGVTGVLVDESEEAIAAGIVDVVDDPARLARLGEAARERAGRYTWEATATGIMRVLADAALARSGR